MTTNQTIDGVPRELIEKAMLACFEAGFGIPHAELRALLDSEPCAKSQAEPDPVLCKFYDVTDWPSLVRELVGHVALLQDSAQRNVKPWEDTFPPTLLPAYIERVNAENTAAQPQGEPVACAHGIRAPHACDQCEAQNIVPDYWEDPDTGTCIDQWSKVQGLNGTEAYTVPLYRHAEQPAPVAASPINYGALDPVERLAVCRGDVAPVAVTLQQVLMAYDYAESHPHKYLRGTTNWCAAVAYKLNACLDELKRLNPSL